MNKDITMLLAIIITIINCFTCGFSLGRYIEKSNNQAIELKKEVMDIKK